MADLNIGSTVAAAYARVAADWKNIGLPAVILPMLIIALDSQLFDLGADPIVWVLICDTIAAFYFHRLFLLAPAGASRKLLKSMSSKVEGFTGRIIWFSALTITICGVFRLIVELAVVITDVRLDASIGPMAISVLIHVPLAVALTLVFARLSFAFPVLAIMEQGGVLQSWRETRGYGLRLVAIYACIIVPFVWVYFFVTVAVPELVPAGSVVTEIVISFIAYMLQFFGLAVFVAMISLSYRTVVQPAVLAGTEDRAAEVD